jgi:hypothetical protein
MRNLVIKIVVAIGVVCIAVVVGAGGTGFMLDVLGYLHASSVIDPGYSADNLKLWVVVAYFVFGPLIAGVCGAWLLVVARRRWFPVTDKAKRRAWVFPAVIGLASAVVSFVLTLVRVAP